MGIITRIGIPLGIAVVAGLVLAKFRDPIIGAISKGAGTVGQALTQPIAGFFEGLGSGIKNIPKLPAFPDVFADIFPSDGKIRDPRLPEIGGFEGFPEDSKPIISPCKCGTEISSVDREFKQVCIPCAGEAVGGTEDTTETTVPTPEAVFKIQERGGAPELFLTFSQIVERFGFKGAQSLNIIDFKNTPNIRERIPVTQEGLDFFERQQGLDNLFFLGTISAGQTIGQGLALDPRLV